MRGGLFSTIYLVVGVLVGVGVIGGTNHFADVEGLLGILEAILVVLIWPLVLFGVDINLTGADLDVNVESEGGGGGGGSEGGNGGGGNGGGGKGK